MTSRRDILKSLGAASILHGCRQEKKRPNIVFFLADDVGWSDLGVYGNRYHETPNLDSLAAKGMKFDHAYAAAPVCSPTRASIMTGRHPARMRLTNWLPGPHQFPQSQLLPPQNLRRHLPRTYVTIAEVLKKAGYATAHIGKWHLGGPGHLPEQQGFDYNFAGGEWGAPKSYFYPGWENQPAIAGKGGDYLNDRLTAEALQWLDRQRGAAFFLNFWFYDAHIPLEAKRDAVERFASKRLQDLGTRNATYAAMLSAIDQTVGRVMSKLRDIGAADNTIIVFTSDNGGLHVPEWHCTTPTTNTPLKAGKGFLYEGGIRVPLLVSWPGVARPGATSEVPVMSTDFYASFGEAVESAERMPKDSQSLVPLLRGGTQSKREALYWHYPHYSNQGGRPGGAVRRGPYKLIRTYEDQRSELYNLRQDPGESLDMASQMAELTSEMVSRLNNWLNEVRAPLAAHNPAYDPNADMRHGWQRDCPT
ncbi:MAG: sulfatase [Bryobacteraceae bacterium]